MQASFQVAMFVPADDCLGDLVCNSQNVCAEGQAVGAHCSATGMRLASAHALMQLTELRLLALHLLPAANCTTGPHNLTHHFVTSRQVVHHNSNLIVMLQLTVYNRADVLPTFAAQL